MPEITPSRYLVNAGWNDVPHLTEKMKKELSDSTPPYLRDARTKGIPSLGSGAIYPVSFEEVSCAPFRIPDYWKRGYGLDVGWNRTAALWMTEDPESGVRYCYAEYYRGQAVPMIHTSAIKMRGDWIRGTVDPASRGRSQDEGRKLLDTYTSQGLKITPAVSRDVEGGIYDVWQRLETGRMVFFTTLQNLAAEYRLYRRDEHGRIVKKDDHLLDCLRYINRHFDEIASVRPVERVAAPSGPSIADPLAGV